MGRKSFQVRPGRKSLDPYSSLPDEGNEDSNSAREANDEIVPNTFDERRDVPLKKRHCLGRSETLGRTSEPLNLEEACVVCDISDNNVSRCAEIDCLLSFHKECMSEDDDSGLTNPYCSYCWYRILVLKSKPLRDKVVIAEKTMLKYLDKEMTSDDTENGIQQVSDQSGDEDTRLSDQQEDLVGEGETSDGQVREARESFQDEAAQDQTNVNRGAGKGHVSTFSWEEHDQVQHKEKQIPSRRRRLILNATDSELSSNESTNEHNGEDVTQQKTSSAQVTTKVTTSTTVRDVSFFDKDKRRRLLWTVEEEEMLKVGVEKIAAEANKKMPWRKILEMGEKVFHETRTPGDLKDKWRNMTKKMTH